MSYEDYSDEDFENELISYIKDSKKQQEEKDAEKHKHLSEMVDGFMGLWWYLRSFRSSTVRNLKTFSAVADREAKFSIWDKMNNPKVTLINEFGACEQCVPYLGQEYTLDEARSIIPIHYNCRCTFVLIEDSGLLAGVGASIESLSRNKDERDNDESNSMSEDELEEVSEWFIQGGGTIISDPDAVALLDYRQAEAITLNDKTILLRPNANRAAIFEELYHAKQYADGIISGETESKLLAEIEAQHYLINNADVLKLSEYEINVTKSNLSDWEAELNEYRNKKGI